jgi:hypothetical protein
VTKKPVARVANSVKTVKIFHNAARIEPIQSKTVNTAYFFSIAKFYNLSIVFKQVLDDCKV